MEPMIRLSTAQPAQRSLLGTSRAENAPASFHPKKQTHHEEVRPEDV
jgi:hypothetical protein